MENLTPMSRISYVIWKHSTLKHPLMALFIFIFSEKLPDEWFSYYFKKICRKSVGSRWVVKVFFWGATSKIKLFRKSKYRKWEKQAWFYSQWSLFWK